MQKYDYNHKLQEMIDERFKNGIYAATEDNNLNDLGKFQNFLRRNFEDTFARYEDMRSVSNQPGHTYAIDKTHKLNSLDDINVDNAKAIAEYLKPLCSNQYKLSDTEVFASLLKGQPPLNDNEEYV